MLSTCVQQSSENRDFSAMPSAGYCLEWSFGSNITPSTLSPIIAERTSSASFRKHSCWKWSSQIFCSQSGVVHTSIFCKAAISSVMYMNVVGRSEPNPNL
uniref:Uncharacterized protein n=1 Tax=Ascaris lumbricoides TaxID=6252 RepID=A0A0M3I6V5_ASCLU